MERSYLIFCNTSPHISHRTRSALQYPLVQGLSVFYSFARRSHLLPDQLPGEHPGDMAAILAFLLQHNNLGKDTMFLLHSPHRTLLSIIPVRQEYGGWVCSYGPDEQEYGGWVCSYGPDEQVLRF